MAQVARAEKPLFGARLVAARIVWLGTTLLIFTMLLASIPLEYQGRISEAVNQFAPSLAELNLTSAFYAGFRTFMDLSLAFIFYAIGLVIFIRKPASRIVILTSIATQTFGVLFVPTLNFLETALPEWTIPVSFIRAVGLATSLIVYFFLIPDGRFVPVWSRWASLLWLSMVTVWFLFPQTPANLIHITNWSKSIGLAFALFLIAYGSGIAAQLYRYRHVSDKTQQQQTKWFVFGTLMGFTGFFLYHLPLVLLPDLFNQPGLYRLQQIFWGIPIYHLFILAIPVCIAISVTRFRLWDIDHLINRALTAGALTIVLTLLYAASVIFLTQLFIRVSGSGQDNLVIALSTLTISTLFFPIRRKVQGIIDRRFYRQRYNTEKTLSALSASLRDEVDLEMLLKGIISLVKNTLHPESIAVWLVRQPPNKNDNQRNPENWSLIEYWIEPTDPIVAYFLSNPNVIEVAHLNIDQSQALNKLIETNVSISVPLIGQGQFIGLVNLGKRLSDQEYSVDDNYLLTILASQSAPALRVAQLVRQQQMEILAQERIDYEMKVARMIQQNFLPKQLPDLPDWQIIAHYQPARAVGGDFYDLYHFPDGRLAIFIGDVAGHGVPAALMMVNIRSMLRDASRSYDSPGFILRHVNNQFFHEAPLAMFVTCLYAILDPHTGEIVFANAGHNLPIHRSGQGIVEMWAAGMPLGIMENALYEESRTTMASGDVILFLSDGLVEARNPVRELFGEERIKDILASNSLRVGSIITDLLKAMSQHISEDGDQEDDVTIVCLHRALSSHNPSFDLSTSKSIIPK